MKSLDPEIWFPSLWFFLRSVAHTYPHTPNAITKRKYYDFVQNIPLFIPHEEWGNRMSTLLDSFPISPYLDNKDSFFYWIHRLENKINRIQGKEEKTLLNHMDDYYAHYIPKPIILSKKWNINKKYIIFALIFICFFFIIITYSR
jgi:hypothetical protein